MASIPEHLYGEEAERAMLGAILVDGNSIRKVAGYLKPGHFYLLRNRIIYETMLAIYERGDSAGDYVLLSGALQAQGKLTDIGGSAYLTQLVNETPTARHIEAYAQLVIRFHKRLQLLALSDNIRNLALDPAKAYEEIADGINAQVYEATGAVSVKPLPTMLELSRAYMDKIEYLMKTPEAVTGIATGYKDYDRLTLGLQPGDVTVIAGRPGMGKSALILSIVIQALKINPDMHVAYFSLEMPAEQIVQRAAAIVGGVNLQTLRSGGLDNDEYRRFVAAMGTVSQLNIHIDDTGGISPQAMRTTCERVRDVYGRLDLVVVDYLQLMTPDTPGKNRTEDVGRLSHAMKQIAKNYHVPVIEAAQLSRAVESRADKRPMLSDLRESGDIENDADIVTFMYRDDYYNEFSDTPGIVELITAKHRNGPTGKTELHFEKRLTKFVSVTRQEADLRDAFVPVPNGHKGAAS